MKFLRLFVIISLFVTSAYGVEYLSSQYVTMLGQRYPAFEAQINTIVNALNTAWTQYKSVEEKVNEFQGSTMQEAHDLNAQIKSHQDTIKAKSTELSDLLCLAQRTELRNQIIEADWVRLD